MCTRGHTGRAWGRACSRAAAGLAAGLALLAGLALAPAAFARAEAAATRLVWAGEARVYIANSDSGAFAPGMLVRLLDRDREVARGEVTFVLDGVVASVRLSGGSLAGHARPEQLRVLVEPVAERALATLRVGLPAPGRSGLASPCPGARLDLSALPRAYRSEALAADALRLVGADSAATAWPETLLVRFYRDRADEEIALERGELDLAVFWPGETSARLREGASGHETLLGARARGVLAAVTAPADSALAARLGPDMAALNAELFGGDLLPWAGTEAVTAASGAAPPAGTGIRYVVDAALPGQRPIERFHNRRRAARPGAGGRAVRITAIDAPVAARDSLAPAWRARGIAPQFTLRCPVLCAPGRAADVRRLGADGFANLAGCGAGGGGR